MKNGKSNLITLPGSSPIQEVGAPRMRKLTLGGSDCAVSERDGRGIAIGALEGMEFNRALAVIVNTINQIVQPVDPVCREVEALRNALRQLAEGQELYATGSEALRLAMEAQNDRISRMQETLEQIFEQVDALRTRVKNVARGESDR